MAKENIFTDKLRQCNRCWTCFCILSGEVGAVGIDLGSGKLHAATKKKKTKSSKNLFLNSKSYLRSRKPPNSMKEIISQNKEMLI